MNCLIDIYINQTIHSLFIRAHSHIGHKLTLESYNRFYDIVILTINLMLTPHCPSYQN